MCPENAGKSKKYRDKEVRSRIAGGVSAFEGIYDEMYDDNYN